MGKAGHGREGGGKGGREAFRPCIVYASYLALVFCIIPQQVFLLGVLYIFYTPMYNSYHNEISGQERR